MIRPAQQTVLDFGALWETRDIDRVVAAMAEDCVYANMPLPPMHGRAAVKAFAQPMLARTSAVVFNFLAIATAEDGKTVMTERIDTFVFNDKRVDVPLMGIFVVQFGLIVQWRDYADLASFVRDMQAIGQTPGSGIA